MMSFKPTPAQQAAIETTDQSIVLSAGAGSGKTRVLVQRYLYLIREGLAKVDEILAITFTNKAAGEMKERIMKEVFKLANQAKDTTEKEFWRRVKEDLNQAQITTFHGFCGQVLRQDPMQARVDPFFKILDEIQTDDFLDESVEEIFLKGLDAKDPALMNLAREFGIYAINGLLKSAYLNSRQSGISLDELAQLTLENLSVRVQRMEELKSEICELVDELIQINHNDKLAAGTKKKLDELDGKWSELSGQIQSIDSLATTNRQALMQVKEILKGNVAKTVKEQINRIKTIIDEELDLYLADQRAQELVPSMVAVLKQIDQRYQLKKEQMNGLDFDDLESLTIQMLKDHPNFCAAYSACYKFIMVDEFQDTNPVQEELIRLLIGGTIDAPVIGNQLFIVGDPKQSIYKFRGADVRVFKKLQAEINQVGTEITMAKNFRSRGKIIEFVNHFFENIFGTNPENPYDMEYQPSEYSREGNRDDASIEFMILDQTELKEEDLNRREEEADRLARRIQKMVLKGEKLVYEPTKSGGKEPPCSVRYGDICFLYQALTNVHVYEEAFRRYRIPYTVVNGRGFFQRQEVWDLLNLLKLLDNSQRVIEWFGVLRSPFCGLSDDDLYWLVSKKNLPIHQIIKLPAEKWEGLNQDARERLKNFIQIYEKMRDIRERQALSLVITDLLEETGYWKLTLAHPYGDLVRANLDKLIGLAREYEREARSSLAGFIKYLERMDEKEAREGLAQIPGQTDQVKLMTVHQSKGLEFPVVILPDTQRPILNPLTFPAVAFDSNYGLGMRVKDPLTGKTVKSSLHADIWETEKCREIAESKRLLYVAATRARDYLLISGTANKFKPTDIDECKSWLDWIGQVFDLKEVAQLPASVPYGNGDQHLIQINLSLTGDLAGEETAVTQETLTDPTKWSELYQKAGIGRIPPRAKSPYHYFGVSELLTYEQCPRWYYHRYIQKMPDSIKNPLRELSMIQSSSSMEGRMQHHSNDLNLRCQSLEGLDADQPMQISLLTGFESDQMNDNLNQTVTVLDTAQLGTLIHLLCEKVENQGELPNLLKKALRYLGHSHLLTPDHLARLEKELTPYIQAYLRGEVEWRQKINTTEWSDHREYPFQFKLANSLIRGVIDRLLITPTGAYIIDYKSNQVTANQIEKAREKYQLQLEIYALAVHYLTGREQIHCRLHFLKPDQSIVSNYGLDELNTIQEKVIGIIEKLLTATCTGMEQQGRDGTQGMLDAFPCQYEVGSCPYHSFCAYHQLCKESVTELKF